MYMELCAIGCRDYMMGNGLAGRGMRSYQIVIHMALLSSTDGCLNGQCGERGKRVGRVEVGIGELRQAREKHMV